MKNAPPVLAALINTGTFADYDLYTIQPAQGGPPVLFSTADFGILYGGTRWAANVRVDQKQSKATAHWLRGFDTDTWTVAVMPRPFDLVTLAAFPDLIAGIPWLQACAFGLLSGASFLVQRAYFTSIPVWPIPRAGAVPVGLLTIFSGVIGEVDITGNVATINANDWRILLNNTSMPKKFFQSQCRHTWGDAGCQGVDGITNPVNFAVNGTIGVGSTTSVLVAQGLAVPTGSATYTLGRIVMTGGVCDLQQRTVAQWDGSNSLKLVYSMPFAPAPGDTFTIFPGCDKQTTTCAAFGNSQNYGGQPDIPDPETAA